jgi:hypothetical protein
MAQLRAQERSCRKDVSSGNVLYLSATAMSGSDRIADISHLDKLERMDESGDLRRNWRTNWLSSVQEFADDESQRRLWLDTTNTNPHFSFVEYLSSYFDDLDLSDVGYECALKQGLLSEAEVAAVSSFHKTAGAYNSPANDYDHEAILADPKWAEVVAAAKRAQAELLDLIDDPHERQLLMEP